MRWCRRLSDLLNFLNFWSSSYSPRLASRFRRIAEVAQMHANRPGGPVSSHLRTVPWRAAALNREIHVIEVAKVISCEVMTQNLDPWKLKTIDHLIVNVCTHTWVIYCRKHCTLIATDWWITFQPKRIAYVVDIAAGRRRTVAIMTIVGTGSFVD